MEPPTHFQIFKPELLLSKGAEQRHPDTAPHGEQYHIQTPNTSKHCVLSDRSPGFCTAHAPHAHRGDSAFIFHTYCLRDRHPMASRHRQCTRRERPGHTVQPHMSEIVIVSSGLGKERHSECNPTQPAREPIFQMRLELCKSLHNSGQVCIG